MVDEENDTFDSVSSSIFYAKRNPPEKQKSLLKLSSTASSLHITTAIVDQTSSFTSTNKQSKKKTKKKQRNEKKVLRKNYSLDRIQPLSRYYPGIPLTKESTFSPKKPSKRKITKYTSPTRQLLIRELSKTKERLSKRDSEKNKKITKIRKKKQNKKRKQKQTLELNHFITNTVVKIKETQKNQKKIHGMEIKEIQQEAISKNDFYTENYDPFPFTNISEWLIWHMNYPELSFVRETYNIEQIPDEEDVDVFWVNIKEEPEFFYTNWQMKGSNIDIELIKNWRIPDWNQEWDIISSFTDGFSTFFEDVYLILSQSHHGLKNLRYPILQFALKGLLLLDLIYFDTREQKWFSKESYEDLVIRTKRLDQFIRNQDDVATYLKNIKSLKGESEWQIGIISFDLLIITSVYIKQFSKNQLPEDVKIQVTKRENLNSIIIEKLSTIEKIEKRRVNTLQKKLKDS